jgi:hypothetical protein
MADKQPSPPRFKLGEFVNIRFSESVGLIVELRGPLAPGGMQVYRLRIERDPEPRFVEVREDQMLPFKEKAPAKRKSK